MLHVVRLEKLIVSASSLSPITPDIQRTLNADVADKIYQSEKEYYDVRGSYLVPHCISICTIAGDSTEYLIDGQHRLLAYKRLSADFVERPLMVRVDNYTVATTADIDKLYESVNTCTPNPVSTLGLDKYKILNTIKSYFLTGFPDYISKSRSPNTPNINVDVIIEWIEGCQLVEKTKLSADKICEYITLINKWYADHSTAHHSKWHVTAQALHNIRVKPNQLFLGLFKSQWVDRLLEVCMHADINIMKVRKHHTAAWRPHITSTLRSKVWGKHGNCMDARPCFCCGEEISCHAFHCGHIIPVAHFGTTTLDNLEAICERCNINMACMNLYEYKRLYAEQNE